MCAPALTALLYPANSSQFRDGSAQVTPPLPHQCCSPAMRVVGLEGTDCLAAFAVGVAATEDPAWLATRANGVTTMTAERAALSESLMSNPFVGVDPDRLTVIRLTHGRGKTRPGAIPLLGSAPGHGPGRPEPRRGQARPDERGRAGVPEQLQLQRPAGRRQAGQLQRF